MFGVLRGASCSMRPEERAHWMNHICGVCLTLRDNSGQASRLCTNYDAALISVLTEAQSDAPLELQTSRCALRGQRFSADVVSPNNAGARYAAAIALTAGATKVNDHLEDKETWLRHLPWISSQIADKWEATGRKLGQALGFSTQTIKQQTSSQTTIEAQPGRDFFFYAQPTELAVASAFQHTAVIAQRPHNAPILHEIGRMFGRIMYLLDSYQDYDDDLAQGKFNPLAASLPAAQRESAAQHIFKNAHKTIRQQFKQLDLPRPNLARKLLIQQLNQRGRRLLEMNTAVCHSCTCTTHAKQSDEAFPEDEEPQKKRRRSQNHWTDCCCDDGSSPNTSLCCCDCDGDGRICECCYGDCNCNPCDGDGGCHCCNCDHGCCCCCCDGNCCNCGNCCDGCDDCDCDCDCD